MTIDTKYECYIEGRESPLVFTTLDQGAVLLNEAIGMPLFTRHILSNWMSGRSKAEKYKHIRLVCKLGI